MSVLARDEAPDIASPRLLPRLVLKRDRILPIVLFASLLLHAIILVPFLVRDAAKPAGPQEIPVEFVQLPPEPPKPEKKTAAPQAQKSPPQDQPRQPPEQKKQPEPPKTEKPPPKPRPAKPPEPKPREMKKPEPKQPESTAERMKDLLGPQSLDPIAMPGESADGTDLVSYGQIVMSRLTKALHRDVHPGIQTYATVSFLLGDAGEIVSETLTRASGDPLLDEEALAVVKRGGPYPPPPPDGKRDYTITLESKPIL